MVYPQHTDGEQAASRANHILRPLGVAEIDLGYACLLDTCAWLEQRAMHLIR